FKKEYDYGVFKYYKNYFEKVSEDKCPFELDLEKAGGNGKSLLMDTDIKIKLNGSKTKSSENFKLVNVINGGGEAYKDNFIEKIMLKGCENINSGIDKGSPKRQLDDFNLNIANAFGSIKERILDTDEGRSNYDKKRIDFLKDLGSKNFDFDRDLIEEIMEYIQCKVKEWYSHLLSDSRFSINDITLWDQAYMTSSMFKAALAAISLDGSMYDKYMNDPRKVKWSILGIQYDKLGLAEKAMNPHFIKWYREKTSKVDEEIKKLVEIDYALGNEIYRDETGIYFIAPENICGNHVKKNDETEKLYYLNDSLIELQNEIVKCFESFNGEIFPAVFLTKPSRGTMNIAYLLKNAKKNFLKPIYPKTADIEKLFKAESSEHFNKICDVCGIRLAEEEINGLKLCSICAERIRNQKNNLIDSNDEETVFTGEIQDKNGRIALVTLKFELDEWLNGNMLNLMLSNFECESVTIASIVSLFKNIRKTYSPFSSDNITTCLKKYKKFANNNSKEEVINVLQYFDKSFIISYKSVMNKMFEDGEYKLPKKNEEKVKYKRRKETFIYYIYK
ncbi:CRISPR-associated protein Csx11, partial [Clostridium sp. HV4-5-A1G]